LWLAIVNPQTRQVEARVRTGDSPHEVAASDDGKLAFVGNYGDAANPGRTISVIDLAARVLRLGDDPQARRGGCEALRRTDRPSPAGAAEMLRNRFPQ
jgi:DNA-binding beta-propeller fold protein YncE